MVRQRHLMAMVTFVIWCAVLFLALSALGMRAEASQETKQERTDATASEEARCEGTRKANVNMPVRFTTNDLPGCPKGGLLSGTDKGDLLAGEKGDDELRGLGGSDEVWGGNGNDVLYGGSERDGVAGDDGDDVLYGGPGNDGRLPSVLVIGNGGDDILYGGPGDDSLAGRGGNDVFYGGSGGDDMVGDDGADVFYGGDGSDDLEAEDGHRDKLYCGEGKDHYSADKIDYVDSSCKKDKLVGTGGPPLLLLAGAALCSALMMLRYAIRSA